MARRLTQEEYNQKLINALGNDYMCVSEYKGMAYQVDILHKTCNNVFSMNAGNILGVCKGCPDCYVHPKTLTQEEFEKRVYDIDPDIKVIDQYTGTHDKMMFYYIPDDKYFESTPDLIYDKVGYPFSRYANGTKPKQGINDLVTTHPEVAQYLLNKEDGYNYSYGTRYELDFKCPICGKIIHKRPNAIMSTNGFIKCNCCSDGISYPEKFMSNILRQLNINYEFQYGIAKGGTWCKNYRYDFYLIDYDTIIEVHGLQHYMQKPGWEDISETQRKDAEKQKLGEDNVSNYIIINASKSRKNYLKEQIMNSLLSELFDLSNVDWEECDLFASKSIVYHICEDWNNGMSIDDMLDKYKIHHDTLYRYLHTCNDAGLLNKDFDKYIRDKMSRKTA